MRRTDTGYCVEVPDLPVCVSTGRTFESALANVREAIDLHLEGLLADGENIPQPTRSVAIKIDDPDEIVTFVEVGEKRAA
jgi:predicted RNase H-like HicB family nuclease